MKRFFISLVVVCTLMFNFSTFLRGTPLALVHAQNTIISTVTTITTIISSGGSSGNDELKNKSPEPLGTRDCHDELVYYYKYVVMEDGSTEKQDVGKKEIKFGNLVVEPPTDYDQTERVYFKQNINFSQIKCIGAPTTSSCTPRFLSCEEQNP